MIGRGGGGGASSRDQKNGAQFYGQSAAAPAAGYARIALKHMPSWPLLLLFLPLLLRFFLIGKVFQQPQCGNDGGRLYSELRREHQVCR